MLYSDKSPFSSVSVNVDPLVPTATPYVAPEWNPSDTVDNAIVELENTTQNLIDSVIRFVIVGGPFAIMLLIIGFVGSRIGWLIWKRGR